MRAKAIQVPVGPLTFLPPEIAGEEQTIPVALFPLATRPIAYKATPCRKHPIGP